MDLVSAICNIPLFSTLDEEAIAHLASICAVQKLKKHEVLFWEGDSASKLFLIQTGALKVFRTDPDGRNRTLRLLGPGDVLGEMALFDSAPRSASVQALTAATLLQVSQNDFRDMLERSPKLCLAMLSILAQRIRTMNSQVECLTFLGVSARLALALKQLSIERGVRLDNGWIKLTVPLTHEEISQLVGSSRESITRSLGELENNGFVAQEGKHLLMSPQFIEAVE